MVKEWDRKSDEARMLLLEASKLGFEIGYIGYMERVDWVRRKIKQMEDKASELGVLEEVTQKYNLSKELGKKRRLQTSHVTDVRRAVIEQQPRKIQFEELPPTLFIDGKGEPKRELYGHFMRTNARDSISAFANLMKMTEESHWVKLQIDNALSGIADIYDILGELKSEGEPDTMLRDGLDRIKSIGWISDYSIERMREDSKVIHINVISMVPEMYGSGPSPVCKIISLALETIAQRAFRTPVQVIEKKCICQGEERCKFVILLRD